MTNPFRKAPKSSWLPLVLVGCIPTLLTGWSPIQATRSDTTRPSTEPVQPSSATPPGEENPPAPGFNADDSDPKAIELADLTMKAMGGRKAWDQTRFIKWRYFGGRLHVWDKQTGDIRLEMSQQLEDHAAGSVNVILMNISTMKGKAWMGGEPVTDPDTLSKLIKTGYNAWLNDGYWMFMPYKLKGSGVTLKYKGQAKMEDGRDADVLTLAFKDAGAMSKGKYDVFIGREDHLVGQSSYYNDTDQAKPLTTTPWTNWKQFGRIMLSDERGKRKHTEIAVYDELPGTVFTSPDPVDWSALNGPRKQD